MARVKIDLPDKFDFHTEIQVCVANVNAGGHLGNDSLLAFLNEALMRFLGAKGFPGLVVGGCAVIVADQATIYKSEGFHGDIMRIDVAATGFHKRGFDIVYRVTNKVTGKEVALAKTGMMFFDYDKRQIAETPQAFKSAFGIDSGPDKGR